MSKKILIKEDALKSAIDAMSAVGVNMRLNAPQLSGKSWGDLDIAKAALSEALEQPATPPAAQPAQQEPVVFYRCKGCGHAYENSHPTSCDCMEAKGFDRVDYYTTPPAAAQRKPLTEEQIDEVYGEASVQWQHIPHEDVVRIVRATEAAHGIKEKNT